MEKYRSITRYLPKLTQFRPSPDTYLFTVFIAAFTLFAILTKNPILILIAATLITLLATFTAIIATSLGRIQIQRTFENEIFAKTETQINLQIKNNNKNKITNLYAYEDFGKKRKVGPVTFNSIPPQTTATKHYICSFQKRGEAQFKKIQITLRLGPVKLTKNIILRESKHIYPAITKNITPSVLCSPDTTQKLNSAASRPTPGFTEYRQGMPANRINWKLSAKAQTIIVRTDNLKQNITQHTKIILGIFPGQSEMAMEQAVSEAATLAIRELGNAKRVSLWYKNRLLSDGFGLGQREKILKILSKITVKTK